MRQLPDQIRSAYVYTKGDRSVGQEGEGATLTADGDFMIDLTTIQIDQRELFLKAFAEKIIEAYSLIWDETVHVLFDFECMDDQDLGIVKPEVRHE